MKKAYLVASTVCLTVPVLYVLGVGRHAHAGVGPWDTDDHPSAESGTLLSKPTNLKIANGYSYTFPSGHIVTLRAISRGMDGPKERQYQVGERAWTPDGAPYLGKELREPAEMWRVLEAGTPGLRGLSFDVQTPNTQPVEVYGYIPQTAKEGSQKPELHGRDVATRLNFTSNWGSSYRTPLVVEGNNAHSYRFGLASGAWKSVFTFSSLPATIADQDLAKGAWGMLKMIAPKRYRVYSGPGPHVSFVVQPADPVTMSFRIRLFDKSGAELGDRGALYRSVSGAAVPEYGYKDVGKIVIEGRPYEFVEFQNVHFDPDPKLWGKAYWGEEGISSVQGIPNVASLEGILKPIHEGGSWDQAELFANDGVRWREYPDPDELRATFSSGTWPDDAFVASFKLDKSLVAAGRTFTIGAYASTSAKPGEGLGAKCEPPFIETFQRPTAQVLFTRPATPYVQFKVTVTGENWQKAGTTPSPTKVSDHFEVTVRRNGTLGFFFGGADIRPNLITWPADGREARLIGRLKSGERKTLFSNGAAISNNDPSTTAACYIFEPNKEGEFILSSSRSRMALKDIEAFEVETRNYSEPRYLVAKLPAKK